MQRIFVNRTLNMKRIKYIGFDMDHTLVRYKHVAFEELAHQRIIEKLIRKQGYPEAIRKISFDPDRVMRGLVVDTANGNMLKLSERGAVRKSYHGTRLISYTEQRKIYQGTLVDLGDPNFLSLDTHFSLSYGNLYAHLVDLKDTDLPQLPSYEVLSHDLFEARDQAHRDGSIKNVVREYPERFLHRDPALVKALERYIHHGKKLFILTNSDFAYMKLLFEYAVDPFLDGKTWQDLFEVVITLAAKPRFFFDRQAFLSVDTNTGSMRNWDDPIGPGVYQGGSANAFSRDLGLTGDEILYVGDHIYGDILRLKKDCAWRTALVVEELNEEMTQNASVQGVQEEINALTQEKEVLEAELTALEDRSIDQSQQTPDEAVGQLRDQLAVLDERIRPLIGKHQQAFNPYWGEVMRIGNELSYYAAQVERYACIYASTLKDIISASPNGYFRSGRKLLPHEQPEVVAATEVL